MVEKLKQDYEIEVDWRPFYLYWDTPPEGRELPEHVDEFRYVRPPERIPLPHLLTKSGLTNSNSEARRKIEEGAVRVGGDKIADVNFAVVPAETPAIVVQVGRRKVRRIVFSTESHSGT